MQDELKTSDSSEFYGKRILVTGGTRGIGEAIVQRLSRGGGKVIATARSLPSDDSPEQFVRADVSTRAGIDQVVHAVIAAIRLCADNLSSGSCAEADRRRAR